MKKNLIIAIILAIGVIAAAVIIIVAVKNMDNKPVLKTDNITRACTKYMITSNYDPNIEDIRGACIYGISNAGKTMHDIECNKATTGGECFWK